MFSTRYWIFLLIVIAAIGYSMLPVKGQPSLLTSPSDPYQYQYLELPNGIKTLLIHTPNTDKAAAAMTVPVGSGDDPKGREGLAHFLEHMLFLGTERYPEAGEYQAFISRHGGSHNAFTAHRQTTYFFEINNNALDGALDRFAPFFISPTFDSAYVDREINAVHAEYTAKLKDDSRRIFSAEKQAMNPNHPYASFSTGNLDTLSDRPDSRIRDELLAFYDQHYSADRMTLVIAGNHPLEQLRTWAEQQFSDVPVRQTAPKANNEPLFIAEQLPLDMTIQPIKELRRLQFTFPMPETQSLYAHKPIQLLSHILGHEGDGSLLALLKQQGWAEGLSAGQALSTERDATLMVQIQLTRDGLQHIDQISELLFAKIEQIKSSAIPAHIINEQQAIADLGFRFKEQGRLSDYAVRLSTNLLHYPAHDVIYGDYRWEPISAEQWQPYLQQLDANNLLRTLIAPDVNTDTLDPWYGTPIKIRPYQRANVDITELAQALSLPTPNPFIPSSLDQQPHQQTSTPMPLPSQSGLAVWFYPEHQFSQPKAQVLLQLQTVRDAVTAQHQMLAHLYARSVNEALNTFTYPAHLAGLNYHLSANELGLQIMVGGYYDKQPVLLDRILNEMHAITVTEQQFQRYRASLQRQLENQLKNKPFERTLSELRQWLYRPSFNEQALLAALNDLTLKDLENYIQSLQQPLAGQLYVHGRLPESAVTAIQQQVESHLTFTAQGVQQREVLRIPAGHYQYDMGLSHPDLAYTRYVQGQDNDDRTRAAFALLGQILSAPYYQTMRTEKQLGYIVFASGFPQQTVPGLVFIVQSPTTKPDAISRHSEQFFADYAQQLAQLSEEDFSAFQQGLMNTLREPAKNMSEKAMRFWRDLQVQRSDFDTNEAIAQQVSSLTLTEIQTLYQAALIEQTLPHIVFTQGGTIPNAEPLHDIDRAELPAFPTKPLPNDL